MADRTKNQVSVAGFQHTNNSIASLLDCPLRQPQHHSKSQSALLHPCTLAYLSSFLFHFFFEPLHDFPIVFFFVRKQAAGAVLDASFCIGKGTAAVFYKVQGTKAEEAVEILSIAFLVTRKKLTVHMRKVLIVRRHSSFQLSASLPNSSMLRDSPLRVGSIPARAIQASAVSPGRTMDFRQVRSILRRWEKAARLSLIHI